MLGKEAMDGLYALCATTAIDLAAVDAHIKKNEMTPIELSEVAPRRGRAREMTEHGIGG